MLGYVLTKFGVISTTGRGVERGRKKAQNAERESHKTATRLFEELKFSTLVSNTFTNILTEFQVTASTGTGPGENGGHPKSTNAMFTKNHYAN